MLRGAFEQLAIQAAGIPGPVGKAVSAIGMLGIGSTVTVGVLAGVGAIAAAYKLAAKTANDLQTSTDNLNKSYRDIIANGNPLVALQNKIQDATAAQTAAFEEYDRLRTKGPFGKTRGSPGEIQLAFNNWEAASRVVSGLQGLMPEAVRAAQLIKIEFEQAAQALARASRTGPGAGSAIPHRFLPPGFGSSYAPGPSPTTFANIRSNMPRFVPEPGTEYIEPTWTKYLSKAIKKGETGFKLTPEFAAMAGLSLLQGAQGGTTSSFLGAAATPIAMINPLAGIFTQGFSLIAGIFERHHTERERNEERRKNELIAAIHEGPVRVSNEYVGTPAQSQYEDRRFERLGGESRLGGL